MSRKSAGVNYPTDCITNAGRSGLTMNGTTWCPQCRTDVPPSRLDNHRGLSPHVCKGDQQQEADSDNQ